MITSHLAPVCCHSNDGRRRLEDYKWIYDVITSCVVAQHCCNDDQQSQWENFDPYRSETPEHFITKIWHYDYVLTCNTYAKFYWILRSRSVRPTNSWNITSCDFMILPLPFLPFYPRDAMLARVFARATCPSVRLSVCLSVTTGIVWRRRKLASWFLHRLLASRF